MNFSSPIYLERFEKACGFFNDGNIEAALEAYSHIFDSSEEDKGKASQTDNKKSFFQQIGSWFGKKADKKVIDSDLLGIVEIYKADCLRILKRAEEAKQTIEKPIVEDCARRFSNPKYFFDYLLMYGCILGELGDIEGMDDRLTRAINFASKEMKDEERCIRCCEVLLYHAKQHENWNWLLAIARKVSEYADQNDNFILRMQADEAAAYACKGMGNYENAKQIVKNILKIYRELPGNKEEKERAIKKWEEFLESLEK